MKRKLNIDLNGITGQGGMIDRQDWWLELLPRISIDIGYGVQIGWLFWGISFYIDEIYDGIDDFMDSMK